MGSQPTVEAAVAACLWMRHPPSPPCNSYLTVEFGSRREYQLRLEDMIHTESDVSQFIIILYYVMICGNFLV